MSIKWAAMGELKLITFDLDDTLWPVEEVIRRAERRCHDWVLDRHPDLRDSFSLERVRSQRDRLIREEPGYLHNLTALRRAALARTFEQGGFPAREAAAIADEAFAIFHEARNEVVFFPGAVDVLEALADSYVLGALSNGNADLKRIGIDDLFAFHHSAESVGRRKPDPDMFQAALLSAGASAGQSLHVGDHPLEDVDAARRHGFKAIWANLLDRKWPSELDHHPHHIHNLHEITDLLPLIDD